MVGCGAIARWHSAAIVRAAPRTDVTAAVDVVSESAEALASTTGARPVLPTSPRRWRADAFDAALVMVPHDRHEEVALRVLEAGRHLLLEKPMAPTLEACDGSWPPPSGPGRCSWWRRTPSTGPRSSRPRRSSTTVPSARSSRLGRGTAPRPWRSSTEATTRGDCRPAPPGAASPSTRGRTGCGPCGCGSARSTRWSPPPARHRRTMEGESLCRALCRFDCGVVASFDALLVPGRRRPGRPVPAHRHPGGDRGRARSSRSLRRERGPGRGRGGRQLLHELRGPDRRLRGGRPRRDRAGGVGGSTPWASSGPRSPCTARRRRGRWESVW